MVSNLWALIAVACIFAAFGIAAGIMLNNWIQKLQKDSASRTADKIRSDAEREAEHILRDARVSAKAETIKEAEAAGVSGTNTSISGGLDMGSQIVAGAANSVINATKSAASKNIRKIKVTIKTNYRILLKDAKRMRKEK